ncbi:MULTISPECIES: YdcF family protein [Paenibacillus]|uniref:YdcF family protein n=1 Tax=Paenibacillus TaxID=44249 RepID=UPI0022B91769|nr:YdcF family protein [Paenibacillus caseinilyticus]MCZ8520076.1 YdcF family protein [Paenibacillus caseinilyticus]
MIHKESEQGSRRSGRLRGQRRVRLFVVGAATLAGCCIAYTGWSIWTYEPGPKTIPTDAAVVLGAAVWGSEPSPVLRERISHGLALYRGGLVRKLIFTGGRGEGAEVAESEAAKRYAIDHGVPPEDILIETTSRITEENLKHAYELGKSAGIGSYTLVSDPLHMKRSMRMVADLGMAADASPTPTSVYRSWRTRVLFWGREVFLDIGYVVTRPFREPQSSTKG